jgi:hypothetical protein
MVRNAVVLCDTSSKMRNLGDILQTLSGAAFRFAHAIDTKKDLLLFDDYSSTGLAALHDAEDQAREL